MATHVHSGGPTNSTWDEERGWAGSVVRHHLPGHSQWQPHLLHKETESQASPNLGQRQVEARVRLQLPHGPDSWQQERKSPSTHTAWPLALWSPTQVAPSTGKGALLNHRHAPPWAIEQDSIWKYRHHLEASAAMPCPSRKAIDPPPLHQWAYPYPYRRSSADDLEMAFPPWNPSANPPHRLCTSQRLGFWPCISPPGWDRVLLLSFHGTNLKPFQARKQEMPGPIARGQKQGLPDSVGSP